MALMRVLTRVDEDGRVSIPKNVRRETGLEPGTEVEIKVGGPRSAQFITIRRRALRRPRNRAVKVKQQTLS